MTNKASIQEDEQPANTGRGRGWASLSPERRKEIASKAGKEAHRLGHAHKWTPEQAREASKRGLEARWRKKEEQGG